MRTRRRTGVRHTHSPKILADFMGTPWDVAFAPKKQTHKKKRFTPKCKSLY